MQVFGNLESLKKEISSVMDGKMGEIKEELDSYKGEVSLDTKKKIDLLREKHKTTLDQDLKKGYSQILGEKTLTAKKSYEEKREELIDKVFEGVLKKAKDITRTAKYINFVKAQRPAGKRVKAFGDSATFKKHFPRFSVDNSIVGVRFEDGEVSYDFTVERMLKVRREELRTLVNSELFKGN